MENQWIKIKQVAVGVESQHNAPAEYWTPREGETQLPDIKELADMLLHAERSLRGRPENITIAILYEAPGIPGKRLHRKTPYQNDLRENLDTLMRKVLDDCVEDAKGIGE